MSETDPIQTGTCLCGAVTVRVTGPPLLTVACHCRGCQKFSASAFSLTSMFHKDAIKISGQVQRGGLKTEGREHFFCCSCLNFVYSKLAVARDRINLRSSILNDSTVYAPFVDIMTEEKQDWVPLTAPHRFARFPQSAAELQNLMNDSENQRLG